MSNYFPNQINFQISKELQKDFRFEIKEEEMNQFVVKEESVNFWPKNLKDFDAKNSIKEKIQNRKMTEKMPKIKNIFYLLVKDLENLKDILKPSSGIPL